MEQSNPKMAAILYGSFFTFLDHLAPLASLLQIPLIVTDEEIRSTIEALYPNTSVELWNGFQTCFFLPDLYPIVISCLLKPDSLLKQLNKEIYHIWLPHGNSDKGRKSGAGLSMVKAEKALLVYGEKMIDYLKESSAFHEAQTLFSLGNFRYHYYLLHKSFYDRIINQLLHKFNRKKKTLLYAPTRIDKEADSSYLPTFRHVIEKLPEEFNLIIKPHPHMLLQESEAVEEAKKECSKRNNCLFLEQFSPIYPLLAHVDLYLGDASSVGYDFLTFDKPLFFFVDPSSQISDLQHCGTTIPIIESANCYQIIKQALEKPDCFQEKRNQLYEYTFGKRDSTKSYLNRIEGLKDEILTTGLSKSS